MLNVVDISETNLEDFFKVCENAFTICSRNKSDLFLYKKGVEVRKKWLINMLEQHGPCAKIAYIEGKPMAQIQFSPEETIPFIKDPRRDVITILCLYNPYPAAQRKGIATALVNDLVEECKTGLRCIGGRPSRFIVTLPFPILRGQSYLNLYKKMGFKQGHKEMYLEINGDYVKRENPEYHPVSEDKDSAIFFYNPACGWGKYYALKFKEIIQDMDSNQPIEICNIWERPEEHIRRSLQRVTSGRPIIKGQRISGGEFWTNREAFLQEIRNKLKNKTL